MSLLSAGTITFTDHTITVKHGSRDHVTLCLFDHVLVSVTVQPSRVHLPSFTFQLLSGESLSPSGYTPFPSSTLSYSSATVPAAATDNDEELFGADYTQSTNTLYCIVNRMRTLGQSLPLQQ